MARWAVIRDANSTAASHGGAIPFASSGASIEASSSLIVDQSLSRRPVTVAGCERGVVDIHKAKWTTREITLCGRETVRLALKS